MTGSGSPAGAPWLEEDAVELAIRILHSHGRAYGRPLLAGVGANRDHRQAAQELFTSATVVLAHDGDQDPRFIYANAAALRLWQRPWQAMIGLPSRTTVSPAERQAREGVLDLARRRGALADYGGTRIDSGGRRFRIEHTRLWTLDDGNGSVLGQAAAFDRWWWL